MEEIMSVARQRAAAVAETVARIRAIEQAQGITPEALVSIRRELLSLAAKEELFPAEDFPLPAEGAKTNSCLYRLSEDPDHRFALYANSARAEVNSPAHNHTTWAAIVGVRGEEENRFYQRHDQTGVAQTGGAVVRQGSGVVFMPYDLHSIHIKGATPVLNFHMYGLGLEQLDKREFYDPKQKAWRIFPAHTDIREARLAAV
jgi:predicted metal-dependent enzyme (double-stranded beta helix superfamily)